MEHKFCSKNLIRVSLDLSYRISSALYERMLTSLIMLISRPQSPTRVARGENSWLPNDAPREGSEILSALAAGVLVGARAPRIT